MRKLKQNEAQGTHGKRGDKDKKMLKLAKSKKKMQNLTMKLSKTTIKRNKERDQFLQNRYWNHCV